MPESVKLHPKQVNYLDTLFEEDPYRREPTGIFTARILSIYGFLSFPVWKDNQ